jgi:hypothetical protein
MVVSSNSAGDMRWMGRSDMRLTAPTSLLVLLSAYGAPIAIVLPEIRALAPKTGDDAAAGWSMGVAL